MYAVDEASAKYGNFFARTIDEKRLLPALRSLVSARNGDGIIRLWREFKEQDRKLDHVCSLINFYSGAEVECLVYQCAEFMTVDQFQEFKAMSGRSTMIELLFAIKADNKDLGKYIFMGPALNGCSREAINWLCKCIYDEKLSQQVISKCNRAIANYRGKPDGFTIKLTPNIEKALGKEFIRKVPEKLLRISEK